MQGEAICDHRFRTYGVQRDPMRILQGTLVRHPTEEGEHHPGYAAGRVVVVHALRQVRELLANHDVAPLDVEVRRRIWELARPLGGT